VLNANGIFSPYPWQSAILGSPDFVHVDGNAHPLDAAMLTGRGPGKTSIMIAMAWRIARDYPGIPIGFFKHERKSLHDLLRMAALYYPTCDDVIYNRSDQFVTFSNGSTIIFDGLQDMSAYASSWQGRNLGACFFDELSAFPDLELCDLMLSNLRGKGYPCKAVYASNPGGKSHGVIFDRWLAGSPTQGEIMQTENGRYCTVWSGTHQDNPSLGKNYVQSLKSATRHDPLKRRMFLTGDFSIQGGGFFSRVVSNENSVHWWPDHSRFYSQDDWRFFLGYDHGTAAPAWCGLFAEARQTSRGADDQIYRKNSLVCVAEFSTSLPDNKAKGDGSTVAEIADGIKRMCADWYGVRRFGYGDAAIFANIGQPSSVGTEFERHGVMFEPGKKGKRAPGWDVVKQWLANAQPTGKRFDGEPALYINKSYCPSLIWELTNAVADVRNLSDIGGSDHALDGTRYMITTRAIKEPPMMITSFNR